MSDLDERVAECLRRGMSYKAIAYDNRINLSTVWRVQSRLAKQLGCPSRLSLIARLRGAEQWPTALLRSLTASEREVVGLTLHGSSNAEIATVRGVSLRTVANQLAAAYRKLGVGSRAELAALTFVDANAAE